MTLQYVTGDLLAADLPAIAHGCNCQGAMGAGIAKAIAQKYPEMFQIYEKHCRRMMFHLGDSMQIHNFDGAYIFNLATQFQLGPDARLSAVYRSVDKMIMQALESEITRIGLPRIGCGIGGLKWEHVEGVLIAASEIWQDSVQLVVYTLPDNEYTLPDNELADFHRQAGS